MGAAGIEHDFIVQPGADYREIRMRYNGADRISLSSGGDLKVEVGGTEVLLRAPYIYQTKNGHRIEENGHFVLLSENEVGFRVDTFDPTSALVIDPVLDYATYLANTTATVAAVAVDAAGTRTSSVRRFPRLILSPRGRYKALARRARRISPISLLRN
jgi:hypothetical protein